MIGKKILKLEMLFYFLQKKEITNRLSQQWKLDVCFFLKKNLKDIAKLKIYLKY